MDRRTEMT